MSGRSTLALGLASMVLAACSTLTPNVAPTLEGGLVVGLQWYRLGGGAQTQAMLSDIAQLDVTLTHPGMVDQVRSLYRWNMTATASLDFTRLPVGHYTLSASARDDHHATLASATAEADLAPGQIATAQLQLQLPDTIAGYPTFNAGAIKVGLGLLPGVDAYGIVNTGIVETLAVPRTNTPSLTPVGIALDASGRPLFTAREDAGIWRLEPSGTLTRWLGAAATGSVDGASASARFDRPTAIAGTPGATLYLLDQDGCRIRTVAPDGTTGTVAMNGGIDLAQARGLTLDATGALWVADTGHHRICVRSASGSWSRLAGSGAAGSMDAEALNATFDAPEGIAVGLDGAIMVADTRNHRIRRIRAGQVDTLAGRNAGLLDGVGAAASFDSPCALASDARGNLWVADRGNHTVRLVTPTGWVGTLAGSGLAGSADDTGIAAGLDTPTALVRDAQGGLYLADTGNGRLRLIE